MSWGLFWVKDLTYNTLYDSILTVLVPQIRRRCEMSKYTIGQVVVVLLFWTLFVFRLAQSDLSFIWAIGIAASIGAFILFGRLRDDSPHIQ